MQTIMQYVMHQWPHSETQVPENVKQYLQVRGLLSVVDGVLTYGDRIVIPPNLCHDVLTKPHESHQGISKCREMANTTIWWPCKGRDIKNFVMDCLICTEHRPTQSHEPLLPTILPGRPREKIGTNFFLVQEEKLPRGSRLLFAVDRNKASNINIKQGSVFGRLKDVFAMHGIPDTLISDNGPQFIAQEFAKFAHHYGFQHNTASPYYPQANGAAEATVKIAKKIVSQEDGDIAPLNYRNTPHSSTQISSANALFGRQVKSKVPVLTATFYRKYRTSPKRVKWTPRPRQSVNSPLIVVMVFAPCRLCLRANRY